MKPWEWLRLPRRQHRDKENREGKDPQEQWLLRAKSGIKNRKQKS
jgi:hypothetical protein